MLSAHIRNNNYWIGNISNLKTFIILRHEIIFSIYHDSPGFAMCVQEKSSAWSGEGADDGSVSSTQE